MKFLISSDFLDLSDTTSIITGGAGMLGRQYTAALLQCGSQVIILDNKSSKTNVINNLKNYENYCKNSINFINENLINQNCYKTFLNVLKSI